MRFHLRLQLLKMCFHPRLWLLNSCSHFSRKIDNVIRCNRLSWTVIHGHDLLVHSRIPSQSLLARPSKSAANMIHQGQSQSIIIIIMRLRCALQSRSAVKYPCAATAARATAAGYYDYHRAPRAARSSHRVRRAGVPGPPENATKRCDFYWVCPGAPGRLAACCCGQGA